MVLSFSLVLALSALQIALLQKVLKDFNHFVVVFVKIFVVQSGEKSQASYSSNDKS